MLLPVPSMYKCPPVGMLVEPEPDIVPPVQISTDVTVSAPAPVIVPPEKVAVTTEVLLLLKLAVPLLTIRVCKLIGLLGGRLAIPPMTCMPLVRLAVPLMLVVPELKSRRPLDVREEVASRL